MSTSNYSIRWTGNITAPSTGSYTFSTVSDDGVRLWVNGTEIISNWTDHSPTTNTGKISLTGGQSYAIKIEYYNDKGPGTAQLSWTPPAQSTGIIQPNYLLVL